MLLLAKLRKNCPCAVCLNERKNKPETYIPLISAAQQTIRKIEVVGSYAIKIYWGDGHGSGIYTFEKLKEGKY